MKKIWIDALTPKQILFFSKLAERLRSELFDVLITTRDFREVKGLLEKLNMDAIVIGRYGGYKREDKLRASIERMKELLDYIVDWRPDLAISFTSPEASRIAFGLGIPHYSVSDSPHSIFVSKLALPLSEILFSPWIIPKEVWLKFGISKERIIQYRGLDPIAWLSDFKPSPAIINELSLDRTKHIVVIRETETYASYLDLRSESPAPVSDSLLPNLLKILKNEAQFIIVPRYEDQIHYLKKKYAGYEAVVIVDRVIDGASLLYYSTLFIGGGGTMNAEAALLGKPVISMFPGETTYVEDYLIKNKLVIRPKNLKEAIDTIIELLMNKSLLDLFAKRAQKLIGKLENPVVKIANYITNHVLSIQS